MELSSGSKLFFIILLVLSLIIGALFFSFNGSLTGLFIGGGHAEDITQGLNDSNVVEEEYDTIGQASYSDVNEFVMEDGTYEKEVTEDYVCEDFSNDLVGNALSAGIPACTVFIGHSKGSHSLVAFNTTDKGVVFLEPQTGEFVVGLEEGEDYCSLAGWNCSWKVEEIKHCFQ